MKNYSLRNRLITWITIPIIITILAVLVFSYVSARHEIEEVYDAQLVHSAKVLLQLTQHEIVEDEEFDLGVESVDLQHRYERNLGFRIWAKDKLVTQSAASRIFKNFDARPGFSNHIINDEEWRFFVYLDPMQDIKVEVSEHYEIRFEMIFELMLSLIIPALLALPFIFSIIWFGVRQVLKPVIAISTDVDARGSDDLSALSDKKLPEEVAPLIHALNALFVRLDQSFKYEREFTDHAAHELRTPLAAMKTQTQVLLKKAADMPDCESGLNNLKNAIERAIHMVEQLLVLARLQHENQPKVKLDLSLLLIDIINDLAINAQNKNITINTSIAQSVIVYGNENSIAILLNNIISNAIKYTPINGCVDVLLMPEGVLTISDTGSGIDDKDKKKVFERFVRADKTGQSGSGLGLAIAKWIANANDLQIQLADNTPNGLTVTIDWNT